MKRNWGDCIKPFFAILLFYLIYSTASAQNYLPDSILMRAKGKPAKERIMHYSRKIFDYAANSPKTAKVLTDSVFVLIKSIPEPAPKVYALRSLSFYYLHRSKYDSAFYYVRQAELLNNKINDTAQNAKILIDFGNIYIAMGSADSALACYQAADSIAGLNSPAVKANALLNIGSVYQTYNLDHYKALEYLEKAYKLSAYSANPNKIILFQKMSIAYRHTQNDSLALKMAQQSYELAMNEGLMGSAAAAINSMAQIYQGKGWYNQALNAYEKARDIAVEMNLTQGIIFTNENIANIYFEIGKYREGLALYKKGLDIAESNSLDYIRSMIYEKMIPFYKKLGDYEQALETSEKLRLLEDTLDMADKEKKIAELEARYQSQIKEDTIANQQTRIKKNRAMIWMLFTLIFIIGVSLIAISRLFLSKKRSMKKLVSAHRDLTNKNKQIIKLLPAQSGISTDDNPDYIFEKIFYYLITHQHYLNETITLEKASADMGINREYIRSAIKNAEGCNFKTFINNHRIDHAKALIMKDTFGHQSIDEIANRSGFSSRTSFYRTFRKVTGFTPAYYKSQLHKIAVRDY